MNRLCKFGSALGLFDCGELEKLDAIRIQFNTHVADFGLSYGTLSEYEYRFLLFREREAILNEINATESSFTVGHNKFSTWADHEYKKLLGYKNVNKSEADESKTVWLEETFADDVDWRAKGVVNPVKDQGQCGSCWAFGAVSTVESHHAIKTQTLLSLSEQQVVDCDTEMDGC